MSASSANNIVFFPISKKFGSDIAVNSSGVIGTYNVPKDEIFAVFLYVHNTIAGTLGGNITLTFNGTDILGNPATGSATTTLNSATFNVYSGGSPFAFKGGTQMTISLTITGADGTQSVFYEAVVLKYA